MPFLLVLSRRNRPCLLETWIVVLCVLSRINSGGSLPQSLLSNDAEYDSMVIDPYSMYGSPFGGYSRSTTSRLANHALRLPDLVVKEGELQEKQHWEISDRFGRQYACRVFDDDELEPRSLKDSFFKMPLFRTTVEVEHEEDRDVGERVARVVGSSSHILDVATEESLDERNRHKLNRKSKVPNIEGTERQSLADEIDLESTLRQVERRLEILEGVCVHKRIDYWTYEWCWEASVKKFHMKVLSNDRLHPKIHIDQMSTLGTYKIRNVEFGSYKDGEAAMYHPYNDDDVEVREVYVKGDKCEESGEDRQTHVNIFCCSEDTTRELQQLSTTLYDGVLVDYPFASIIDVWEDADNACDIIIDICSPVLCFDTDLYDIEDKIEPLLYTSRSSSKFTKTKKDVTTTKVKNTGLKSHPSVGQILEQALGSRCVESVKDGWWTYEYCHKHYVRQFNGIHEASKRYKINLDDDSQYLLGFYNETTDLLSVPRSEEWKHVVNITSEFDLESQRQGSTPRGGNGAFYEVEFDSGEICIMEDAEGDQVDRGSIERAASVRFSCHRDSTVVVREDSTCHYVVEVTVPELCQHPFFRPELTRKRTVKCMPVNEIGTM